MTSFFFSCHRPLFLNFLGFLMFLNVLNHGTGLSCYRGAPQTSSIDELHIKVFVFHNSEGELVNNKFKGDKVHNDKG